MMKLLVLTVVALVLASAIAQVTSIPTKRLRGGGEKKSGGSRRRPTQRKKARSNSRSPIDKKHPIFSMLMSIPNLGDKTHSSTDDFSETAGQDGFLESLLLEDDDMGDVSIDGTMSMLNDLRAGKDILTKIQFTRRQMHMN